MAAVYADAFLTLRSPLLVMGGWPLYGDVLHPSWERSDLAGASDQGTDPLGARRQSLGLCRSLRIHSPCWRQPDLAVIRNGVVLLFRRQRVQIAVRRQTAACHRRSWD